MIFKELEFCRGCDSEETALGVWSDETVLITVVVHESIHELKFIELYSKYNQFYPNFIKKFEEEISS